MKIRTDEDAWLDCHPDDLWVFDKLLLSKRLGYICGPKGVDVPSPGNYIIRPCVNLMGMGRGAHIKYVESETDDVIPDGTFWCEIFSGRHLSVDYHFGEQVLCVDGTQDPQDLSKWLMWRKVSDLMPLPDIVRTLSQEYEWVNVEFIDGKIIEIHFRQNPDFIGHRSEYIIPSYGKKVLDGHEFIPSPDYGRLGYFIKI